ncbi:MAG TPA: twin-arginine translocase TatA/TatE family subunit [Candidatus Eremiobacteraceae bacterium]|nr:twin-arginine translocase TatA/TatE family subunit [Candidatus Eremiobacteraceae bacterium]
MILIFAIITGPEIAVLVGLAVLLFGADRIPKLARSMGQAKKEFESAQRGETSSAPASPADSGIGSGASSPPPATPTPPPAAQP